MGTRLVIVPGLGDSGPGHWQSRLEHLHAGSLRVRQRDWWHPDLREWADAILARVSAHADGGLLVAHSFGCLAAAAAIRRDPSRIRAALLVAPANPARFGLAARLPRAPLEVPVVIVASGNDPWCRIEVAQRLADRWDAQFLAIGRAGHINVDSGHGPWPFGEHLAARLLREHGQVSRRRPGAFHPMTTRAQP